VGWIGISEDWPGHNERENDDDELDSSATAVIEQRRFGFGHDGFTMEITARAVN
jgi:hypothetical protein